MVICQTIVKGAVLFFQYRFLLRTLGADLLGVWAVVLATTSVSRVSELGLAGGAIKFVAAATARGDLKKAADVIQTALISIGVVLVVILAVGYPLLTWVLAFIVPAAHLPDALAILPYALISILLGGTSGVVHASLDGCQRADLRALVDMVATVGFFLLVLLLVPIFGLIGMGLAQIFQACVIIVLSWIILKKKIAPLPVFPYRWNSAVFREMLHYGVNFQIISLFIMLYGPLTKACLTKFGGLGATAFYEMAHRMVMQFRSLIVSANQVVVPKIAAVHETSPEQIHRLYDLSYRIVLFLAMPLFAMLVIAMPFIGHVWIGDRPLEFVLFGILITLGYLVNTLSSPSYFLNLGIGTLRWNVLSHVAMGIFTAIFGVWFGILWGGEGVVAGSVLALVLASLITIAGTYHDRKIPIRELFPKESRWLVLASGLSVFLGCFLNSIRFGNLSYVIQQVMMIVGAMLVISPFLLKHPVRRVLAERLLRRSVG